MAKVFLFTSFKVHGLLLNIKKHFRQEENQLTVLELEYLLTKQLLDFYSDKRFFYFVI